MANFLDWKDFFFSILTFLRDNAIGILLSVGVIIALGRVVMILAQRYIREDAPACGAKADFEQKKDQIQERLKKVRSRFLLRYNYITPKVYVRIAESGIELALRYMVRARRRRTVEDAVSRNILKRFYQEKTIDFAYPTMRVYRMGENAPGSVSKTVL
jgi:hypothetical protein